MTVATVSDFVRAQILAYTNVDETIEACGLVYGESVVWITNRASDPAHYFEMDNEELLDAFTEFGQPDAVWHSHPDGNPNPSETDRAGAPPGVDYLIVADNVIYTYRFDD